MYAGSVWGRSWFTTIPSVGRVCQKALEDNRASLWTLEYVVAMVGAGVRWYIWATSVQTRCNRPEYIPGRSIPGYIMASANLYSGAYFGLGQFIPPQAILYSGV